MTTNREQTCAAQHFGLWAIQERWINAAVSAYNAGTLPMVAASQSARPESEPLYSVDGSGVAFIAIQDQITKGQSSYGGTSSVQTRQALRAAEADQDVKGIMMLIDSPGGSIAGLQPLSDEAMRIRRAGRKLIAAHAEDAMHSAALWVGAQAGRVTASAMTEIGSIGVLSVVSDLSGMAEKDGVKVHVVSTGDMKGAFVGGTEVTDAQLAELQKRVDEMGEFFLTALKAGRGIAIDDVRTLADGRDWMAADAKARGLIDEVMSQDDAVKSFRGMIRDREAEREHAAANRRRRAAIAGLS